MLLLIAAAVFAGHLAYFAGSFVDDVFISLRYARNVADGFGWVFNPGERVEGYTNFALVAWAAAAIRAGADPIVAVRIASVCAALVVILVVARFERLLSAEAGPASFPRSLLFLLPLPAFAYWTVVPLETSLFALAITGGVVATALDGKGGRRHRSGLWFGAASLVRPEAPFVFLLALASRLRWRWTLGDRRALVLRSLVDVALFAALFLPYQIWRISYYGALLPNTFRAKVVPGLVGVKTGLLHLGDWALAQPLFAAVLAAALASVVSRRLRERLGWTEELSIVATTAAGLAVYVVAVGGDSMPFFRFYLPLAPLLALLAAAAVSALAGRSRRARPVLPAVFVAAALVNPVANWLSIEKYRAFVAHRTTVVGRAVGRWLGERLPSGALVAVNTAGSLPYYWGGPTLDTLGLTDAAIATRPVYVVSERWSGHRRGWGRYVLERRPEVVFFYNSAGSRRPHYLGDRELAGSALFRFGYALEVAEVAVDDERDRGPLASFLGAPFGQGEELRLTLAPLGLRGQVESPGGRGWLRRTVLHGAAATVEIFRADPRDLPLWSDLLGRAGNPSDLVDFATARWFAEAARSPEADPQARRNVEELCERARRAIQRGDRNGALKLLFEARRMNDRARSPRVHQYLANVAVLEGRPWLALAAAKEALRLDPTDALKRSNLISLLAADLDEVRAGGSRLASPPRGRP